MDHSDQMVSYSSFHSRTLKWWKRVIFHVINLAVLNSYLVYKHRVGREAAVLSRIFRKWLIKQLVQSVDPAAVTAKRRAPGRPTVAQDADTVLRLQGKIHSHLPRKIQGPPGCKPNFTRACVVCEPAERAKFQRENPATKKKRHGHESTLECSACERTLYAHPCFKLYHSCVDYQKAYLEWKYPPAAGQ